jgi:hypothetical protein
VVQDEEGIGDAIQDVHGALVQYRAAPQPYNQEGFRLR